MIRTFARVALVVGIGAITAVLIAVREIARIER